MCYDLGVELNAANGKHSLKPRVGQGFGKEVNQEGKRIITIITIVIIVKTVIKVLGRTSTLQ